MQLNNIKKHFGGIEALKGIDFELKKGEVHGLIGENGAGKSTLIKIITGVYQANSGSITLDGKHTVVNNPIDARRQGIAAIYQELSLIDSLTVAENIFLGNEPVYTIFDIYDRKLIYKQSAEYLDKFGIDINSREKVSNLGMGQKRIIEIVKALAVNSKFLLLDEPTTGMSKSEIDMLFEIIDRLRENNVTMIYISHYLDEIFRVCDRTTVLRNGENVGTFDIDEVTTKDLVKKMIGKNVDDETKINLKDFRDKNSKLELRNFKTKLMENPVNLTVKESEILGITGIVGSGKSEIAHSIFGNSNVLSGEILINNKKVEIKSVVDAKRYNMAFIPEDRKSQALFLNDSIANNIVVANIDKIENKFKLLDKKRKEVISTNIGEQLSIKPLNINMPVKNLSGGNQQKVVIGKWVIGDPDIIIMDEPTRGIDVGAKFEIYNLIKKLSSEGKSIIIMSSEFDELISLCDRILVLRKGEIVEEVMPNEATNEKLLSLSLGGNVDEK